MSERVGIGRCRGWWLVIVLCVGVAGCGEEPAPPRKLEHHIQGLWHVYLFYWEAEKDTPVDAQTLKAWAEKEGSLPEHYRQGLRDMGFATVGEVFVSPRDKQPYVVRQVPKREMQSVAVTGEEGGKGAVLAHEAQGVNGKRYVVFARGGGQPTEVTETAFRKLVRD